MSMNEKKTYTVHPTIIDNTEYRDLITENCELSHEAEDYRQRYWKEQDAKKTAEAELAKVKSSLEKFNAFIASSDEVKAQFEAYLAKEALKASGGIPGQLNL